jgi:caa(3)-type oxidase subunit IV
MNDLKTSADLKQYSKRCFYVFLAVVCGTLAMVAASFAPVSSSSLKVGLVLAVALFNAVMVATFLMHLVSEKRFVLVVLAFTVFFFISLLALTVIAAHDVPAVLKS